VSAADDLSRRLAAVVAKTPGQMQRLAEITSRADEDAPQCGFHAHNPISGKLAQCVKHAEVAVIVAATKPSGGFTGDGVKTQVCAAHGRELVGTYGAVLVPEETGSENE
jgi:hypothetical protein